jgi:hypothetical protein
MESISIGPFGDPILQPKKWMTCVITKILFAKLHANGYKNTTMPTSISFLQHQNAFQKEKTIQLGNN